MDTISVDSESCRKRLEEETSAEESRIRKIVDEKYLNQIRFFLFVTLASPLSLEGESYLRIGVSIRKENIHRDRAYILRWSVQLDYKMRDDFVTFFTK